jgi:hypothetical protein
MAPAVIFSTYDAIQHMFHPNLPLLTRGAPKSGSKSHPRDYGNMQIPTQPRPLQSLLYPVNRRILLPL